jgi:hypothetical protein
VAAPAVNQGEHSVIYRSIVGKPSANVHLANCFSDLKKADQGESFSCDSVTNDFKVFLRLVFRHLHNDCAMEEEPYLDALLEALQVLRECQILELAVNMPPRMLKTTVVSVAWVAWMMGRMPGLRVILGSYAKELSCRNLALIRGVMQTDWYQHCFGPTKILRKSKDTLVVQERGELYATSPRSTIVGMGGDLLILDDPHNPAHSAKVRASVCQWFSSSFLTRRNSPKAACVVIGHRTHADDLFSKLQWPKLSMPVMFER